MTRAGGSIRPGATTDLHGHPAGPDAPSPSTAPAADGSEEKYPPLIESLRQGYFFYRHDPEGRFTYLSPSITEVLGYDPNEFLKHYTEYLPEGPGRDAVVARTDATLRGERQPAYEVEIRHKDGRFRVLEVLEEPVLDGAGRVVSVEGIAHDITGRKEVERELSENRRRLETLLANLPGMAYRASADEAWRLQFASEGCLELTGHSPEDFISRRAHYGDLVVADDRTAARAAVGGALAVEHPYELLYRIRTAAGAEKWVWDKGRGVRRPDGALVALEGFITDISDRKRAEAALARSEQRSRELVEKINDCVFSYSRGDAHDHAAVDYVGPQIEVMTGWEPADFVRDPGLWDAGVHPDDAARILPATRRLWEAPARLLRAYRFRHRRTGAWRWLADTLESHADAEGVVRSVFGVVRDVTEAKEAEEALRKSQRELASYHDLITHDLSNFAMKLLGVFEILLSGAAGPLTEEQTGLLRRANRQSLELDRLAENARVLTRLDKAALPPTARQVDLAEVLERAAEAARAVHFDRQPDLRLDVPPKLAVAGLPFLDNILLNLIDNAIRYGPAAAPVQVDIVARRAPDPGRVSVVVRGGIVDDPGILAQAFERYARGPRSTGSGLGLAVARELLAQSGAAITARAVPDAYGSLCEIILDLPGGT